MNKTCLYVLLLLATGCFGTRTPAPKYVPSPEIEVVTAEVPVSSGCKIKLIKPDTNINGDYSKEKLAEVYTIMRDWINSAIAATEDCE